MDAMTLGLFALGLAGLVAAGAAPVSATAPAFDIPFTIAVMAACLPVFFAAIQLPAAGTLFDVMLSFVVPLTAIALSVGLPRELAARRQPA